MPDYAMYKEDSSGKQTHAARCATGVNPVLGQLLGLNSSGEWILADQDGGVPASFIALKNEVAGRMLTGLRWAIINAGAHGLTVGGALQLSDTPGAFENANGTHQIVGRVLTSELVYLEPLLTYQVS